MDRIGRDREWDRRPQVCEKSRTDPETDFDDPATIQLPTRSFPKDDHGRGDDVPVRNFADAQGLTFSFGVGLNVTVPVGELMLISASASSASFAVMVDTAGSKALKVCSPTLGPAVGVGISVAEATVQAGLLPKDGATFGVRGVTSSLELKAAAAGGFIVMGKASYGGAVTTVVGGDIKGSRQPEFGLALGLAAVGELSLTGCITIDVTDVVDNIISRF